jgi:hypothetical protein
MAVEVVEVVLMRMIPQEPVVRLLLAVVAVVDVLTKVREAPVVPRSMEELVALVVQMVARQ